MCRTPPRPHRLLAQLISDVLVIAWIVIWVLVGMAVHSAVSTIADVGRQVEGGANGIADNLDLRRRQCRRRSR